MSLGEVIGRTIGEDVSPLSERVIRPRTSASAKRYAGGDPAPPPQLSREAKAFIARHCELLDVAIMDNATLASPNLPYEISTKAGELFVQALELTQIFEEELRKYIQAQYREMRPYYLYLRQQQALVSSDKRVHARASQLAARFGADLDSDIQRIQAEYAARTFAPAPTAEMLGSDSEPQVTYSHKVQQATAYLLQQAARPSATMWIRLDRNKVLEQAILRLRDPFTTNIYGPYFCGPTFLMSVLIEKEPLRYARLVVEVLTEGKFDGKRVSDQLFITRPSDNSGSLSVDWMMMSAMRNTHPNPFGRYLGESSADYVGAKETIAGKGVKADSNKKAGTSVGRMKSDVGSVLGYRVIAGTYYWKQDMLKDAKQPNCFVEDGLPEMMRRLPTTYDPDENTACAILTGGEGSGVPVTFRVFKKKKHTSASANAAVPDAKKPNAGNSSTPAREVVLTAPNTWYVAASAVNASHWQRILTRPTLLVTTDANGNPQRSYTFELFEHGRKRTETWTEADLNAKVYGYVIAERE